MASHVEAGTQEMPAANGLNEVAYERKIWSQVLDTLVRTDLERTLGCIAKSSDMSTLQKSRCGTWLE